MARVQISGITAEGAELPAILTGYADQTRNGKPVRKAIHEIEITDYQVAYRDNEEILHIPAVFDEFLTDYPECNAHGDVDACGLWIRHADEVKLKDIHVQPRSMNNRAVVKLHDVGYPNDI
ncbi:MAG: hypothetical protein IJI53_01675 [Clostridia bacterium]|nr:hypothetical protein [Clostridia bacterium]MBR0406723.1 hypothetical protein [Clostridia bacterium]